MQDGNHDLHLSVDGYDGAGSLKLVDGRAEGGNGVFRIEGNLFESAGQVTAVVNVLMPRALVANTQLPEHFSLRMTGATTDRDFQLIGAGPLGVIVAIACTRTGPLRPKQLEV